MNASFDINQNITSLRQRQLPKIFYSDAQDYIYPPDAAMTLPSNDGCYLPIEVDTEFYHPPIELNNPGSFEPCQVLTVQARAIGLPTGTIFTHPDSAMVARHPLFWSDFFVVDYLRSLGYEVALDRFETPDTQYPVLQIDLYAFFAVAELFRTVRNECAKDIRELVIDAESREKGITQGRRLRSFTRYRGQYHPWVDVPWVMTINSCKYLVRLCWYDTCAVHGAVGYADFCKNTGTPIPYKDLFTPAEKADMLRMYCERPDDFDNYALGDLYNHTALLNNEGLFKNIYKTLGLEEYYRPPRLTTGATVRDLIESRIAKMTQPLHPQATPRELVNAYCRHATSEKLKENISFTGCFNAKVDGARCRNNRPTDTVLKGALCDIDIKSCYGEGLRIQLYPLGVPVIIDSPIDSSHNDYQTLDEFIKEYDKELVPGLWQARVSTPPGYQLQYSQDFLMSWYPPKDIRNMPCDTKMEETDEWWSADNVGLIKIFSREIKLAMIGHDFIQWLDHIASPRQRKELYDNLRVVTAMYYPACERVDTVEELRDCHDNHKGRNTCRVKNKRGKTKKISILEECHAWYAISLGEMCITQFLLERAKYVKKSPENELYKLITNTSYGDMVSSYFSIGNVVVGNAITARARAMAWYMEKGLHGVQTITDGCVFDLNRVLHPDRDPVNGLNTVSLYRDTLRNTNLGLKPLAGVKSISFEQCPSSVVGEYTTGLALTTDTGVVHLNHSEALEWIQTQALDHLKNIFPAVDVLHQENTDIKGSPRKGLFSLEVKGVHDIGVFHGSANYSLQRAGENQRFAMRAYSRRSQEALGGGSLSVTDNEFYPATRFLKDLLENSRSMPRQSVYLRSSILKCGDYSKHYKSKYEGSKVYPGITVKTASYLREFSLAQFTYQSHEQYRGWERETARLQRHYGQSYEQYFLNPDGTLDYQRMIETIDGKIAEGKLSYWDGDSRRSKHVDRLQKDHPSFNKVEEARSVLADFYRFRGRCRSDDDTASEMIDSSEVLE